MSKKQFLVTEGWFMKRTKRIFYVSLKELYSFVKEWITKWNTKAETKKGPSKWFPFGSTFKQLFHMGLLKFILLFIFTLINDVD